MARSLKRGTLRFFIPVGNPADPDGLFAHMKRYLEYRAIRGSTPQGLWNVERYLRDFIAWCDSRGIERPHEVTRPILETYQRYLYHYRKKDGQPLSLTSQRGKIVPLKGYFKWLARNNHILHNPASELEIPKMTRRLPKHVLSVEEVESVMRQADTGDPLGVRDRAVMEVLYSTGMRRMEIAQLKVQDIDAPRGTVLIRQGKGRKDRLIPIGQRALYWVDRYLAQVRLHLVAGSDDGTLFLTQLGEPFNYGWLSRMVSRYIGAASIGKTGACHLFRHTMATQMLENGCDIRFIQAMLGHSELSTTEIYTQVAIRMLKQVHAATHPADASLRERDAEARQVVADEAHQVAALMALLDDEAEEERREATLQ